jgi:hypothetical protein
MKLVTRKRTSSSGCKAYPRIKYRRTGDFGIQLLSGKECELTFGDVRKLSADSGFQVIVGKVRRKRRVKNWVRSADLQKTLSKVGEKNSIRGSDVWL